MALQDFVRWLLPREDHFFDYLERQASVAYEGAVALAKFRESSFSSEAVAQVLSDLEHRGDTVVQEVEEALARTFVTPIDREDIHKLSNELDNVIDLMNHAARSCLMFGVDRPTPPMVALMDTLIECTQVLTNAVPMLRRRAYGHLTEAARSLRRLEKQGDKVFREALITLFHDPKVDAKQLMREKEVLEDLENAVDHCDHVAETLSNLAIKHG